MIRMFLVFFVVFSMFFLGIPALRSLSGQEKWELTKIIFYSILCAVLTVVTLGTIVILF